MYVATTRARDHLVASLFHGERARSPHAAVITESCSQQPDLWCQVPTGGAGIVPETLTAVGENEVAADTEADREMWLERRTRIVQQASRPSAAAATSLANVNKEEAESAEEPYRRGRGGTNLGRAVHSVLQSVDLATGAALGEISKAQAAAEGISDRWQEVAHFALKGLDSPVVERAEASGRYYREVFISTPMEGGCLEGFIDLLFEDGEGMVIADCKTDLLESDESIIDAKGHYALQAGAYVLMVEQATGKPAREVVLIFLQSGQEVVFDDIAALISPVREKALMMLGVGRDDSR